MSEISHDEIEREARFEKFENTLEECGLPIEEWSGNNGTKTTRELFAELEAGETGLEYTPSGEIARVVEIGAGDIWYKNLRLVEDRQVFNADGTKKRRPYLHGAMSEKMKAGEDPYEAVLRGIEEELGITGDFKLGEDEVVSTTKKSPSYPGLMSTYKTHKIRVEIDDASFKPEGYLEIQEPKTTYFVWKEAE